MGLAQAENPTIYSASTANKVITTDGQELVERMGENLAKFSGSQMTFPQAIGDAMAFMTDESKLKEYEDKLKQEWA